ALLERESATCGRKELLCPPGEGFSKLGVAKRILIRRRILPLVLRLFRTRNSEKHLSGKKRKNYEPINSTKNHNSAASCFNSAKRRHESTIDCSRDRAPVHVLRCSRGRADSGVRRYNAIHTFRSHPRR